MKTLTTKIFCIQLQLYKVGIMIGSIYIAFHSLIIWSTTHSEDDDYAVILLSSLTIMTSIILIYALIQNRHALLLPWLSNVAVLILFNIVGVIAEFEECVRTETRFSFYVLCVLFMALEAQVLFWYTIFALLRVGHRKTFRVVEFVPETSPVKRIENPDSFKIYLVGTDVTAT